MIILLLATYIIYVNEVEYLLLIFSLIEAQILQFFAFTTKFYIYDLLGKIEFVP